MKHVGKMKNNGAPVAIVFRTLPGDPHSCLVVGTQGLGPTQHDSLMSLIETPEAQTSFELGTILAVRRFPDNATMLPWLHQNGSLKKIATKDVIVTATPQDTIQLDELNVLIAEQKGCRLEDLAISDGSSPAPAKTETITKEVSAPKVEEVLDDKTLAAKLRTQAESMQKEVERLLKEAEALDPAKVKAPSKKRAVKQPV